MCRRPDGAIAGAINVSQIFYGGFRSAYLGFYADAQFAGQGYIRLVRRWRDHERWAITAEDLRQ